VPVNPSEMLKLEKKEGSMSSSTKAKEKVIQPRLLNSKELRKNF
jgi:hypothetical protein